MPTTKGDVGAFLISYGVGYVAVDAFAAGLGLPPPITTAALTAAVVVGAKNSIQAFLERSRGPQSPKSLRERTTAFDAMLESDYDHGTGHTATYAAQTRARLLKAREFWENNIDDDAEYEQILNELIATYKAAYGLISTRKGT